MANCGGSTTRALAAGGAATDGDGAGANSGRDGERGTGRDGLADAAGTADCGGVAGGAVAAAGGVTGAFAASGFVSPDSVSADLFAAGETGSIGIDPRTGTFTSRGLSGAGVKSGRGVWGRRVPGLGQLFTPPACTVPHQAQKAGWVLSPDGSPVAAGGGLGGFTMGSGGTETGTGIGVGTGGGAEAAGCATG